MASPAPGPSCFRCYDLRHWPEYPAGDSLWSSYHRPSGDRKAFSVITFVESLRATEKVCGKCAMVLEALDLIEGRAENIDDGFLTINGAQNAPVQLEYLLDDENEYIDLFTVGPEDEAGMTPF
jgi:hypothetical protein